MTGFQAMQREFGSDEVVYVLTDVDDPFAEPTCSHLLALGDVLKKLPFVEDLRSLSRYIDASHGAARRATAGLL